MLPPPNRIALSGVDVGMDQQWDHLRVTTLSQITEVSFLFKRLNMKFKVIDVYSVL